MQAVKSKRTKLEDSATRELWRRGHRFRRNVDDLFGKPDIALKKYRAAIFIDSCFWHGCELHCTMPVNNREYWVRKIERNKKRDAEVTARYTADGWRILRVWEHEMKQDLPGAVEGMSSFLEAAKNSGNADAKGDW